MKLMDGWQVRWTYFCSNGSKLHRRPECQWSKRALNIMLSSTYITSTKTSPHHHLGPTLPHSAPSGISESVRCTGQTSEGLVKLFCSWSPWFRQPEALLRLNEDTVHSALQHLHSYLCPWSQRWLCSTNHPSFHDFLIDSICCNDPNFFCDDASLQHMSFKMLPPSAADSVTDICRIGDPSTLIQESLTFQTKSQPTFCPYTICIVILGSTLAGIDDTMWIYSSTSAQINCWTGWRWLSLLGNWRVHCCFASAERIVNVSDVHPVLCGSIYKQCWFDKNVDLSRLRCQPSGWCARMDTRVPPHH